MRQLHGVGQELLAQKTGLSQGYLSLIEGGSAIAVSEEALGRIAAALGIEPWVILAQAAGLKLDQVERFTEGERIWLDAYRALDSEQRDVILEVATMMRRPQPRRKDR
jgi:transcriptional regulator with XRE-family HTH domain